MHKTNESKVTFVVVKNIGIIILIVFTTNVWMAIDQEKKDRRGKIVIQKFEKRSKK